MQSRRNPKISVMNRVFVHDGSYSVKCHPNGFIERRFGLALECKPHIVLAVNCPLPTEEYNKHTNIFINRGCNDTVIMNTVTGEINFINSEYLTHNDPRYCSKCGQKLQDQDNQRIIYY